MSKKRYIVDQIELHTPKSDILVALPVQWYKTWEYSDINKYPINYSSMKDSNGNVDFSPSKCLFVSDSIYKQIEQIIGKQAEVIYVYHNRIDNCYVRLVRFHYYFRKNGITYRNCASKRDIYIPEDCDIKKWINNHYKIDDFFKIYIRNNKADAWLNIISHYYPTIKNDNDKDLLLDYTTHNEKIEKFKLCGISRKESNLMNNNQYFDVCDKTGHWYEAKILEITNESITVQFCHDCYYYPELIPRNEIDNRFRPLYYFTEYFRAALVGDYRLYRNDFKWIPIVITAISGETVRAKMLNTDDEIQFNIYSEDYGVHGIHDRLIEFEYYNNASTESKGKYYYPLMEKPKNDIIVQNEILTENHRSIATANEEKINKIRSEKRMEDRVYTNTSNRNSLDRMISPPPLNRLNSNSKYNNNYQSSTTTNKSSTTSIDLRSSSPTNKRSSMNSNMNILANNNNYHYSGNSFIDYDRSSSLTNNDKFSFDNLLDDDNNDDYDSGKEYIYSDSRKRTIDKNGRKTSTSLDDFNLLENNVSSYSTSSLSSPLSHTKTSSPSSRLLNRKGLCGLFNIGNTCYMNSILQCLNNCTELTNYMKNDKYIESLKVTKPKGKITESYASVIKDLWNKNISDYVNPSILKNAISLSATQFIGCSQNDSHEFLSYLLDGMNEELAIKPNGSVITDIFQGKYISKIQCECGNCSTTEELFTSLTLAIPSVEMNRCLPKYSEDLVNYKKQSFRVLFYEDPLITPIKLYVTPVELTIRSMKIALIEVMNLNESSILHVAITDNDGKITSAEEMLNELKLDSVKTYYVFNDNTPDGYVTQSTYRSHIYTKTKMHMLFNNLFFINFVVYNNSNKTKSGKLLVPRYFYVNATSLPNTKPLVEKFLYDDLSIDKKMISRIDCDRTHKTQIYNVYVDSKFKVEDSIFTQLRTDKSTVNDKNCNENMENNLINQSETSFDSNSYTITLENCLNLFLSKELLVDKDKYDCSKCMKLSNASKQYAFVYVPNILIIHFARFSETKGKNEENISYPNILDLSPYMKDKSDENNTYNLIGVVCHTGTLSLGHYIAYGFNHETNKWYKYNDTYINEVDENECHSPNAYILFYERIKSIM